MLTNRFINTTILSGDNQGKNKADYWRLDRFRIFCEMPFNGGFWRTESTNLPRLVVWVGSDDFNAN